MSPSPLASPASSDDRTVLTGFPPPQTTSHDATFSMTSPAGTHFQCKIQGPDEADGGWSDCTSPVSYSGLRVGDHHFRVRSVSGDHKGPPTSYDWTVVPMATLRGPAVTNTAVLALAPQPLAQLLGHASVRAALVATLRGWWHDLVH